MGTSNRQLKIDFLKQQNHYARSVQHILSALQEVDAQACMHSIEKAVASRSLVKKLWEALPDEKYGYPFVSIEEQTNAGSAYLPTGDFNQKVTLHLGWDVLSFSCSLDAAWHTWKNFDMSDPEFYNCCIYPDSLEWYIIRAGNNLYPMMFSGAEYRIKQ
ncbi:MAG: hypothetical protein ACO1NX_03850 [Chitinophagaceae bacterium]